MKESIIIELDKQRHLRYGYRAISSIEDELDKPIGSLDFNNLRVREIAAIIRAGLMHENKEITTDNILEIIDENDIELSYVTDKMTEAINSAFGAPAKKQKAAR